MKLCQKSTNVTKTLVMVESHVNCFLRFRGVVHKEFLPIGQLVNKEYYLSVMRRLRESIRKKRPDLWKTIHGFCITITHHCTPQ